MSEGEQGTVSWPPPVADPDRTEVFPAVTTPPVVVTPPAAAGSSPAPAAFAPVTAPAPGAGLGPQSEIITCPECGTVATVTVNRRDAQDFCRNCDYPLFWTPSRVLRDSSATGDDSLRRLPGTVGRATVASLACPHCAEPNAVSATVCIRCGRSMQLEAPPPPPPPPVYIPPPPVPEPVYVEPERGLPWWAWVLICVGIAVAVGLITWAIWTAAS